MIAAKLSPGTRAAYKGDLRDWLTFCGRNGVDPLMPPLLATVGFRDWLAQNGRGPSAVRRGLSAMSHVYRQLGRQHLVEGNPFRSDVLAWPEAPREGKTAAVPEDVAQRMLAACAADDSPEGARDLAILRLLYDQGWRRSSVASLRREGLRGELATIQVKGGRLEPARLTLASRAAVDAWLDQLRRDYVSSSRFTASSVYVFPGKREGSHINVATINKLVRERAAQVGARDVHPHCFRAAWVTAAYDAEVPEIAIQRGAHHADLETTRRYDRGKRGLDAADKIAAHREKERK